jgi:hypothetical protein
MLCYQTNQDPNSKRRLAMLSFSISLRNQNVILLPSAHDSPSSSAVNADRVVWPNGDAQVGSFVFALPSSRRPTVLALASLGLNDQPCRPATVVFLLHELQLGSAVSDVWFLGFGGRGRWREQGCEPGHLQWQGGKGGGQGDRFNERHPVERER